MLEAFEQLEASPAFQREMRFSELRHIVVIAVNSRAAPATDWDRKPAPPSIVSQLIQASSVPIDHFSFESVEVLRDMAARWADRRELAIARRLDAGQSRTEAEAEAWPIVDPVLKANTPVYGYEPNTWGPSEVDKRVSPVAGWHDPNTRGPKEQNRRRGGNHGIVELENIIKYEDLKKM